MGVCNCSMFCCMLLYVHSSILLDIRKRNNRSHGKRKNGNLKRKNKHVLTLLELNIILKHYGRHMALSRLVTLSISSLRNLDIEANKFYVRAHRLYDAAILTRCYTQHALRAYIDSEINHIRHFIKIQFVIKGIEFINLPSIFKDKSVISSIPTYFENKDPLSFVISIINLFVVLFLTITN